MTDLFFNITEQVELFNEFISPGVVAQIKSVSKMFDQTRKEWRYVEPEGKYAKQVLMMKGAQSHGARSDASYPAAQQSTPEKTLVYIKRAQMFSMGFDGMALEAAKGRGAAMKPVDFEQEGLFIGVSDDMSRQLILDGSGRLAQVLTGGNLQTHDLKSPYFAESNIFLRDDRKLESYDATNGKGNDAVIESVVNSTEIKLTEAVDLTANDYLFNEKAHADSELNGLGEMMGLCGIISDANPPYPNAALGLQGLKVADYPAWKSWVFDNGGVDRDLTEDLFIQVLNRVERHAKVDVILVSEGVYRSWFALLTSYKTFSNQKTMWGGWTGLPFYYHGREIPVVSDYFVPDGWAFFISNSNLILHVLTPNIVTWETGAAGAGGILQKVPRMNQFVAEGHIFANLGTGLRRGFGLLKDIQEP
ncbi:MAG: hypothetical protein KAV87_12380 [Desulfobacteraceae bacterium]|nr:hypothetical protein [Desulfobacteraceae bacterium]